MNATIKSPGEPEFATRRHVRILLVEDDAVDRMACRRALQQHPGYECELYDADTGGQGLQLVQDHEFDCILLDYHLPDMTGLEFLREITDAMGRIQVPVLKLTGSDNVAIAIEAMKHGARDYLIKDTEGRYLELLPAVIERVLGEQRVLEEKGHAEIKYRMLVEHLPSITYILAIEEGDRSIFISPQIASLGFTPEEWIEQGDLWFQQIHPEDRDLVMQLFLHSRNTGEVFRCDYRIYTRSGDILWFHDEASMVRDEGGKMLFMQGVMLDITEKKAMEAELVEHRHRLEKNVELRTAMLERRITALESANENLCTKIEENMAALRQAGLAQLRCQTAHSLAAEAILDVDAGGLLTLLNPAAEGLLMIDREKALGRPLVEVLKLTGSGGLTIEDIQRRCLGRQHESVRVEAATLLREDGVSLAVSGSFAPIVNEDGEAVSLLVLLQHLPL
ncbi:MAG: response regulator [Methylophilaceae bacterium]